MVVCMSDCNSEVSVNAAFPNVHTFSGDALYAEMITKVLDAETPLVLDNDDDVCEFICAFVAQSKKTYKISEIKDLAVEFYDVDVFLNYARSHFDNDTETLSGLTLPVIDDYIAKFDVQTITSYDEDVTPVLLILHIEELDIKAAVLADLMSGFSGFEYAKSLIAED